MPLLSTPPSVDPSMIPETNGQGVAIDDLIRKMLGQKVETPVAVGGIVGGSRPAGIPQTADAAGGMGLAALQGAAGQNPGSLLANAGQAALSGATANPIQGPPPPPGSPIGEIAGPGVIGDKTGTKPTGMYEEAYKLRQRADEDLQKMGYDRKDIDAAVLGGKALPSRPGSTAAVPLAAGGQNDLMRKVLSINGPGYAADGSGRRVVPDLSDYERFSPYALSPEMRQSRMAEIGQQKQADVAEKLKGMDTGSAEKVAGMHGQTAENVARINQGGKEQLIRQIIGAQVASGQPLDPSKLKDIMDLESAAQKDFAEQRAPTPKTAGVPGAGQAAATPAPQSALEGLQGKFDTTGGTYAAMEKALGPNQARELDALTQKPGEGGKMAPVPVSEFLSGLSKARPGLLASNPDAIGNWLQKKYGVEEVKNAVSASTLGRAINASKSTVAGTGKEDMNAPIMEQIRSGLGIGDQSDKDKAAIRRILKVK